MKLVETKPSLDRHKNINDTPKKKVEAVPEEEPSEENKEEETPEEPKEEVESNEED